MHLEPETAAKSARTFFSAVLATALLLAWPATAAAGWSDIVTVTEVVVEATNRGYARTSMPVNAEECGGDSTVHRIDPSTDYGKTLLSMLMAAKLSGQVVRILQNGCDDRQRPVLLGLWLVQPQQ